MVDVNAGLKTRLEARGLKVDEDGYWLKVDGQAFPLRGRLIETENAAVSRLDIQIPMPDGRLLWESYAAQGDTVEDALDDGLNHFSDNALSVLASAFFGVEPAEDIAVETWEIEEESISVLLGNLTLRSGEEDDAFIPEDFREVLKHFILRREWDKDTHWVRVFVAQKEEQQFTEVLWDNEIWPEAVKAIDHLGWEPSEPFRAIRLFLAIQPNQAPDEVAQDSGVASQASQLLDALFRLPPEDHGDEPWLYDLLMRMGFERELIQKVLRLLPIAFGRKLLKEMDLDFSDLYLELDGNGEILLEDRFSEDPVFGEIDLLDLEMIGGDLFGFYANSSAEANAINAALENGSEKENLVMLPVVIYDEEPTPEGLAKGDALIAERAQSEQARSDEVSAAKNPAKSGKKAWWQFWG